ncbi:MAG: LysR family transcriptional regulator [Rhizobiaceae bacterium]|nr:LysR family transcriptional regulator [Rhizobiaceae bacterium]
MKINSVLPNINLRHLRALHAIHVHGSFARAATELGVVPSALSETVRQFEESVGDTLFDRNQRPPAPTPLALTFLQETAPLLEGIERAVLRLQVASGSTYGMLSVGSSPSAISTLVAPALARFRKAHPTVRVRVHDDIAERLARLVVDGELDLAVAGRALHSPDLRQTEIMRDPFGFACSATHPLAARSAISLDDIDPAEVISLDPGTGTQQLLSSSAAVPTALRAGAIEAHSTIAQIGMIRAGLGVALLPRDALMVFADPSLRFIPVGDLDLWRSLYLLVPTRRRLSLASRGFIDMVRAVTPSSIDVA